jgi:phosphatidylserine synthase
MNQLIHVLLVLAAVLYVVSGLSRFLKFQIMGHDPTVWFRGSMGLLGFSIALMLWQILQKM